MDLTQTKQEGHHSVLETLYIKLEMPGTPDEEEEKPAGDIVFQSKIQWSLVCPSMSTERPQSHFFGTSTS